MSSAAEEWRAKRRRRQLEREQEEVTRFAHLNLSSTGSSLFISNIVRNGLQVERERQLPSLALEQTLVVSIRPPEAKLWNNMIHK